MPPTVKSLCSTLVFCLVCANPATAEELSDFAERISAAYQTIDRPTALMNLFYLDGVDHETRTMFEQSAIPLTLGKHDDSRISFEALPFDFVGLYVADGYEYKPNLKLLGYVVLDGRTRAPYGAHGGRYFFTGMTRTLVDPNAPPDVTLQMIVMGFGVPAVEFTGFCDVMQSNNKMRRIALKDNGHGNNSVILRAQYIDQCRVVNESGHGSLQVRLIENGQDVFVQSIEASESLIAYQR